MRLLSRLHQVVAGLVLCAGAMGCAPRQSPQPAPYQGGPGASQGGPGASQGGPGPSQGGPAYGGNPGAPTQAPPAGAPPEATLEAAIRAGVAGDFQAYLALVHSAERQNQKQITDIERFSWARFSKQARWYLDANGRFAVDRRTNEGEDVMLYVHDHFNAQRMPPPLRLRPDQGAWRIAANSL